MRVVQHTGLSGFGTGLDWGHHSSQVGQGGEVAGVAFEHLCDTGLNDLAFGASPVSRGESVFNGLGHCQRIEHIVHFELDLLLF